MSEAYETQRVLSLWRGEMLVSPCQTRKPLGELLDDFCREHRISRELILSHKRIKALWEPRQDFWRLAYDTGHYSLLRLASYFDRDHTSILHGIRKSRERENSSSRESSTTTRIALEKTS